MTIPTLVTLEQLMAHLRITPIGSPPSDPDLQLKLDAATQLVCEYIADRNPADEEWIATIEGWTAEGSPQPPKVVVLAVLIQAGDFYRYRGDDAGDDMPRTMDRLSPGVANLLTRYRLQVFA